MGRLVSDVARRVRKQFGDTSGAQIQDPDIYDWVSDAQVEIARKTECTKTHVQASSLSGRSTYTLPDDFLRVERVTYNDYKIEKTTQEELDQYIKGRDADNWTATPSMWYEWGREITLYPSPADNGVNNIDIWYLKMPAAVTDMTTVLVLPDYLFEDIVRYCFAKAKESDDEMGEAQAVLSDLERRLTQSKFDAQVNDGDSYPSVRALPGDDGWLDYTGSGMQGWS